MENLQPYRFTFFNSFALSYSQKMSSTVPQSQQGDHKLDQQPLKLQGNHRLSQNKIKLLQIFKSAINRSDVEEVRNQKRQIRSEKNIAQVSLPCIQIKQQSQQSDSEVKTDLKSLPCEKDISKIAEKHEENQKNKMNKLTDQIFQEKYKLERTNVQQVKSNQILEQIRCSTENMQKKLYQYAKISKRLCKGITIHQYCSNSFKKQKIGLYFSEDFKFLSLYNIQTKQFTSYSMKYLLNVSYGLKSKRFNEYYQKGWKINQELCLSLMFEGRSFDFQMQILDDLESIKEFFKIK